MSVETLTLTGFLLARIAEDEALKHGGYPGRVLAECEAKRRIVEAHPLVTDQRRLVPAWPGSAPGVACANCGGNPVDSSAPIEDIGPCDTLLALAAVYADHPDYRQEWVQ